MFFNFAFLYLLLSVLYQPTILLLTITTGHGAQVIILLQSFYEYLNSAIKTTIRSLAVLKHCCFEVILVFKVIIILINFEMTILIITALIKLGLNLIRNLKKKKGI